MKLLFWTLGAFISLVIAAIPETAMYFLYGLIQPSGDVARALVLLAFWFLGAGMCLGFGALGIIMFCAVTSAVLK